LRQALNAPEFLKRAEKVIPYPIEIIAGNEEARLIFMGVEHTQPEKAASWLLISAAVRRNWSLAKILNPNWWKAVVWAASASRSFILRAEPSMRKTSSAPALQQRRNWKRWPGSSVFRAGTSRLRASGTIKAAHEVLLAWGKGRFITPERLKNWSPKS
jgi:exopolyphosphatase/guanosine-5'-triphosphate,3'-diphosphate pyrophosphatase